MGHCSSFYSVAQHSLTVAAMVPREYRLEALLHDAAEAYCHDIAAPIKAYLPDYQLMLRQNELAVRLKFALPAEESQTVKFFDDIVGTYERSSALTKHDAVAPIGIERIVRLAHQLNEFWKGEVPSGHNFPSIFPTVQPATAEMLFLYAYESFINNQEVFRG
jgi:5'-deoxynucleotidase YfbR-like HD superfamily hydrolase